MKKKLLLLLVIIGTLASAQAIAQCANSATLAAGDLTPPGVGQTTNVSYATGEYVLAFVTAGANYTVSTCSGTSSFDTQLIVYDDATGSLYAYNDDYCGLQSAASFTASTCGYVRVILSQYYCNSSGLVTQVSMTMNSAGNMPLIIPSPDVTTCPGVPVMIGDSAVATGGTLPYTYAWTPAVGLDSNAVSNPIATVSTSTAFYLEVKDANNCPANDTVNVTLYPAVIPALSDSVRCSGTITLNAGNPGSTYTWSDSSTAQTLLVSTSGTYYVTVTNPSGCTGYDTAHITINPLPVVSLGTDTTQCGGTVTLDAGNPGFSYLWNDGITTQTFTATTSGSCYVTVTDPVTACAAADTINVTISSIPVINLGADTAQCGGTVILDAGNTGMDFLWNDSTTLQTLTAAASGSYYVTIMNPVTGCLATDSIMVTINALPSVSVAALTTCSDYPAFTLTNGLPAGGVYSGTGVSGGMFDPLVSGDGTFVLTYMVTGANSCSAQDTATITVNVCTGIEENSDVSSLNIYPNPSNGLLNIDFSNADGGPLIISILSLQGREVYSLNGRSTSRGYHKTISTEELAKGIYYIRITTGSGMETRKLAIQ